MPPRGKVIPFPERPDAPRGERGLVEVRRCDQAEAIVLCDLWGFTYEEIAAISGCAVGTVRSRISRGRVKLLKILRSGSSANAQETRS